MPEITRIGESECYFAANQPMRCGIQIVYSLEVEHCNSFLYGEKLQSLALLLSVSMFSSY